MFWIGKHLPYSHADGVRKRRTDKRIENDRMNEKKVAMH